MQRYPVAALCLLLSGCAAFEAAAPMLASLTVEAIEAEMRHAQGARAEQLRWLRDVLKERDAAIADAQRAREEAHQAALRAEEAAKEAAQMAAQAREAAALSQASQRLAEAAQHAAEAAGKVAVVDQRLARLEVRLAALRPIAMGEVTQAPAPAASVPQ